MTDAPTLFDPASLRAYVDKAFAAVPAHHGRARVKLTLPDGTVSFEAACRFDEHWILQGSASWCLSKHQGKAEIEILASW
jgi:hypothetical protein